MNCPRCQLINPKSALRCDCGYDFQSGEVKESYLNIPAGSVDTRRARAWRITLGAILLLISASTSAKVSPNGDVMGAWGALIFVMALIVLAVRLIASGLEGAITDLEKLRRRIWYKLLGVGLLVMLLLDSAFAALSWFTAVALVTLTYWFGWTWIAWLIAHKKAVRHARIVNL